MKFDNSHSYQHVLIFSKPTSFCCSYVMETTVSYLVNWELNRSGYRGNFSRFFKIFNEPEPDIFYS